MGDKYTLTLHNESAQPGLNFAVYAVVPVTSGQVLASYQNLGVYPLAWLAKPAITNGKCVFHWTLDFFLLYAEQGCASGGIWSSDANAVAVTWIDPAQNTACLNYDNGRYTFDLGGSYHPVKPETVYLDATATVPPWTAAKGPSAGLAIAAMGKNEPTPAIVTDTGPNLEQEFDLRPSYYIHAANIAQGTMADMAIVTRMQKVEFAPGKFDSSWTFTKSNTWVQDPGTGNHP
jgi:hypothetical protein